MSSPAREASRLVIITLLIGLLDLKESALVRFKPQTGAEILSDLTLNDTGTKNGVKKVSRISALLLVMLVLVRDLSIRLRQLPVLPAYRTGHIDIDLSYLRVGVRVDCPEGAGFVPGPMRRLW